MERRKFVIGLGSLAAGGAAATGTGAFTAAELEGRSIGVEVTDDAAGLLALRKGGLEDGYFGYDAGELTIDVSNGNAGVNPDSVYQLGDVPEDLVSESALDSNDGGGEGGDEAVVLEDSEGIDTAAFKIVNQSSDQQDVEVEVNMEDVPDEFALYLVAENTNPEDSGSVDTEDALIASETADPNNNWNTVLSFTDESSGALRSGGEILVSIIIERGAKDATDDGEWTGTMSVSAGDNDDILSGDELTNSTDDTETNSTAST